MANQTLRDAIHNAGYSVEQLAHEVGVDPKTAHRWVAEDRTPYPRHRFLVARVLGVDQADLWPPKLPPPPDVSETRWNHVDAPDLNGVEAIELIRRVEASDTGPKTLAAITDGIDRLCRAYTHTPPSQLLVGCRAYQGYLAQLLDGRATLAQRKELMNLAGWLSLLTATAYIDVGHDPAARSNIGAARTLSDETGDGALAGWIAETEGWKALTDGNYDQAITFCQAGLDVAPQGTSAQVQLLIQHARASAKVGDAITTYRLLDEGAAALDRMAAPEHPEHHYVFDPRRLVAYSAGALVALADDDTLAEDYARRAVAQYDTGPGNGRWVHRLALARVDLALVLARAGQPSEAVHLGMQALGSWRVVASDIWLIGDLDQTLTGRYGDAAEVDDFHDSYLQAQSQLDAQRRALPPGP